MTLARKLADTAGRPQVDKNLLINGGMNVWQRNTNATGLTASGYYAADRWKLGLGTLGTWSIIRSTDVPSGQGFGYSLKMDCTTADASPAAGDFLTMEQSFEGQNLQHIMKGSSSAKSTVLTFWVKSNKTGTYNVEWYDEDNTRHFSKSYTIDSANTWEKKTISIPPDVTGTWNNDNTRCSWISFWLAAGSNYTTGSSATSWASITQANRAPGQVNLADSTSNEFYITGCQLEIGEAATDFQFEPYDTVLRKCQRYFYKVGGGGALDSGTYTFFFMAHGTNSGSVLFCHRYHPVVMRAEPSYTSSGSFNFNYSNTSATFTPGLLDGNVSNAVVMWIRGTAVNTTLPGNILAAGVQNYRSKYGNK
jgi:hypothetical protein